MSDERRKMNRPSTGTVPKVKYRNNYERHSSSRSWTNNLTPLNFSESVRNSRRNLSPHCSMNTVDEQRQVNGSLTPSSSTSRRNSASTVPKCDNVTKYPDKKQIEDKLSQIREYLQITTSLMSSMKNTDEQLDDRLERDNLGQMISDLRDSESKLLNILQSFDEIDQVDRNDNYSEASNVDEQMSLQQKAENKMRDARQLQEKLMMQYDVNNSINQREKNYTETHDFDAAIRELEERTKRLNDPHRSNSKDKLISDVDSLHNQILSLHNINEDRNQMIQILDNRDSELRAQHQELQNKLSELQTKKSQIDHLVSQLQTMEEDDDDVGTQVRRIVTMKDQLAKLKDMLEIVKTTEGLVQNGTQEEQELACEICTKAENILLKDDRPENKRKQLNKNSVSYDRQSFNTGTKPKTSKMALQAELEAKKRELEAIMGKHKAGTSNLNHDVGTSDNKSELSSLSNTYYDGWVPANNTTFDSSESDEPEEHAYSQHFVQSPPKPESDYIQIQERLSSVPRTPEVPRSRNHQVQKQLELIRSVCDSMLEPQQQQQQQNVSVRNNLTPNSLYSEPRNVIETQWAPPPPDPTQYQGWLATNTLQTQAFMLNTLNQCCQMLWLQQRELTTLRQTVTDLMKKGSANQVAAASCSLPNLNQYNIPSNLDPCCYQNNIEQLNNAMHAPPPPPPQANLNTPPPPIWNGQALNNQVAPGNRANNYWDNFRSYSRQNLLSSKSNESNPFTLIYSKSNSDQMLSQENTPRRSRRRNNGIPPDVLNVNHNLSKPNEELNSLNTQRNEWHEEQTEEQTKSKLFEELREHVYKEVVTLISANETRPHFLIQLFRDLQMISSDPLRLKILQAIQSIITHSLNRQEPLDVPPPADGAFSLQSTVWSKSSVKKPSAPVNPREASETDLVLKELVPFLNDHEDDLVTNAFLLTLKQLLLESDSFQNSVRDAVFKKHFSNVLDEVLDGFHGKKVRDVKMHALQAIGELLRGELSFIQLIQDTCAEATNEIPLNGQLEGGGGVQNGDLAEADQERPEEEDLDEEGAVGGFWDVQLEATEEGGDVEFQNNVESQTQFIKQGLDQVPTRLPTRSRSNTPNKDRSASSRSDHPDQF